VVADQIESIAGHIVEDDDLQLTWFVVTYADGDEEHREGTMQEASDLAATAGLSVVAAPSRSFKWAREAGA
jgi:hypothetical protein